tara:strand:- start:752 stop:1207 length:456 start_codon:yes stop_codon:yes gene_type:complete
MAYIIIKLQEHADKSVIARVTLYAGALAMLLPFLLGVLWWFSLFIKAFLKWFYKWFVLCDIKWTWGLIGVLIAIFLFIYLLKIDKLHTFIGYLGAYIMMFFAIAMIPTLLWVFFPETTEWVFKNVYHFLKYVCSRNPHEWFVYFFPNAEMF